MRFTGEKPVDPLILNIFPMQDGQRSSYTLYEDSAKGEAYKHGACAWTEIDAHRTAENLEISIKPVRGHFAGMQTTRSYELRLPADWPPDSVTVNARRLGPAQQGVGWRYEGNTLTTVVSIPRFAVAQGVHIVVHREPSLLAREAQLDGFAGAITRLRSAYDSLNQTWPSGWSPEALISAMQTGDRLSYAPSSAEAELGRFQEAYRSAVAGAGEVSDRIQQMTGAKADGAGANAKVAEEKRVRSKLLSRRAEVQLEDGRQSGRR